jgi:hypothetical protein
MIGETGTGGDTDDVSDGTGGSSLNTSNMADFIRAASKNRLLQRMPPALLLYQLLFLPPLAMVHLLLQRLQHWGVVIVFHRVGNTNSITKEDTSPRLIKSAYLEMNQLCLSPKTRSNQCPRSNPRLLYHLNRLLPSKLSTTTTKQHLRSLLIQQKMILMMSLPTNH